MHQKIKSSSFFHPKVEQDTIPLHWISSLQLNTPVGSSTHHSLVVIWSHINSTGSQQPATEPRPPPGATTDHSDRVRNTETTLTIDESASHALYQAYYQYSPQWTGPQEWLIPILHGCMSWNLNWLDMNLLQKLCISLVRLHLYPSMAKSEPASTRRISHNTQSRSLPGLNLKKRTIHLREKNDSNSTLNHPWRGWLQKYFCNRKKHENPFAISW